MDSNNHVAYSKEHIRFAVLSFFLAQGLCFSSWASRIPDIKEIFTVNDALYWGIVLFMIPVGKFVAIPLAGYLVSKLGKSYYGADQYYGICPFSICDWDGIEYLYAWGVSVLFRCVLESV